MLTNNFYAVMARMPESVAGAYSLIYYTQSITACDGLRCFIGGFFKNAINNVYPFPAAHSFSPRPDYAGNGVHFGTGMTPATVNDWKLERKITSGVNFSLASESYGADQYGNPEVYLVYSATNTGNSAITISEIGWSEDVLTSDKPISGPQSSTGNAHRQVLFDHTILDDPITIAAGETGLIKYTIHTDYYKPKTVAGVEIVPFGNGTDEQIVAMIEAARAGTIDLQTDAGWQIGDIRAISVGAVDTYNPYTEYVYISSFDEYESCGNVLQLDFSYNYLSPKMNSSNTNVGGYGSSYMCTTFLPLVEAALPSWLRGLLLPFNVKASAGSGSSEIVTVQNNKLALRSEVEVYGATTYSAAGEGQRQEAFKRSVYRSINTSTSSAQRWLRSPVVGNSLRFINTGPNTATASNTYFIAPFMCV